MKIRANQINREAISLHATYLAAAIAFSGAYMALTNPYVGAPLADLVQFTGRTPFQFRLLPLMIARLIELIHPVSLRIVFGIMTIAATYLLLVEYSKFLALFIPARQAGWLALAVVYPLAWNYWLLNPYLYPSDIPAILFFVVGSRALATGNWKLYWLAFLAGLVNRESICFLSVAFAISQTGRTPKGRFCLSLGAQAAIWLSYKFALSWHFRHNPGSGAMYLPHVKENLAYAGLLANQLVMLNAAATFGGIWLLTPLGWHAQPIFVKKLLLLAPVVFAGMWYVGNIYEVRIYGELIPIITSCAVLGLRSCLIPPKDGRRRYAPAESIPCAPAIQSGIAAAAMLLLVATALLIDWRFRLNLTLWDFRSRNWDAIVTDGVAISCIAMGIGLVGTARLLRIYRANRP